MDLSNNNEASSHFDDITERNEEIQRNIDARVEDMLKDKDAIEAIIEYNSDVLASIIINCTDKIESYEKIEASIRHWAVIEVEQELG